MIMGPWEKGGEVRGFATFFYVLALADDWTNCMLLSRHMPVGSPAEVGINPEQIQPRNSGIFRYYRCPTVDP